jgi:FixJ family two-component response regulator
MENRSVVHVVDDDDSVRKAVSRLLKAAGYEVKGYANAGEFLMAAAAESSGCIILDVCMPGPSGMELQDALQRQRNRWPIIFLTGHGDIPMSVRAMKAGAVDFLTKPVQRQELLAAVARALEIHREQGSHAQKFEHLLKLAASLTEKEQSVFTLVVEGKLNKQIAALLGMAERTVKAHRAHVMTKLHASSLAELVRIAEDLARAKSQMGS